MSATVQARQFDTNSFGQTSGGGARLLLCCLLLAALSLEPDVTKLVDEDPCLKVEHVATTKLKKGSAGEPSAVPLVRNPDVLAELVPRLLRGAGGRERSPPSRSPAPSRCPCSTPAGTSWCR